MKRNLNKHISRIVIVTLALSMTWGCFDIPVYADTEEVSNIEESTEANEEHLFSYINDSDSEPPESISVRETTGRRLLRSSNPPSKWDYENFKDYMPELRDQAPYGSCWAMGTMALAEINLTKKQLMNKPNLSEAQLAYFSYNWLTDPLGGTSGDSNTVTSIDNYMDVGGNYNYASNILASWTGATWDAGQVKYPNAASFQSTIDQKYAYASDVAHLQNYKKISINPENSDDMKAAKNAIMELGALGVCFYAQSSKSSETIDSVYNSVTNAYYDPTEHGSTSNGVYSPKTNHAVVIVGWDDDFSAEKFAQNPGHDGAWLIRNSWTTGSYEDNKSYSGYFWMSYYNKDLKDCIGLEFDLTGNYHNNYQYDGGMMDSSVGKQNIIMGANVFRAHASGKGEILKAVSFSTASTNVRCTANIYVSDDPIDGEALTTLVKGQPASSGHLTTTFAGYYTVTLDNPVTLNPGQYFAVVICLAKDGQRVTMGYERKGFTLGGLTIIKSEVGIEPCQSFYYDKLNYSDTNESWYDIKDFIASSRILFSNDTGNLRIKAFTDNIDEAKLPVPEPENIPVNKITFGYELGSKPQLDVGKTDWICANIEPAYADYSSITWSVNDEKIATITSVGASVAKVTGVGEGTAIITATADDKSGFKATYSITVSKPYTPSTPPVKPSVSSIKLYQDVVMEKGMSYWLLDSVIPEEAYENPSWSSDNESVITFDGIGNAVAVGPGTATITATIGKVSATCKVTVWDPYAAAVPQQIEPSKPSVPEIDNSSNVVNVNYKQKKTISAPRNKKLKVISSNKKVATAKYNKSKGTITIEGKSRGVCTISVKYDGITETINVNAEATTTKLKLSKKKLVLKQVGKSASIGIKATPKKKITGENPIVTCSDTDIIDVVHVFKSDKIKITAKKSGTATVNVKVGDKTETLPVVVV